MLDSGHHFEAIQDCFAFCNVDLSAIAKSVAKNQSILLFFNHYICKIYYILTLKFFSRLLSLDQIIIKFSFNYKNFLKIQPDSTGLHFDNQFYDFGKFGFVIESI